VELGLRALAGPAHITLAHTYVRTRVSDAGFGSDVAFQQDERLLRRPEHVSSASMAVTAFRNVRLLADVRRVGSRDDLDFTIPGEWSGVRTVLPAYTTADVGVTSTLRRSNGGSVEVQARIRNLFDERYTEIYNFPAPGRVFELGLRAGTR
jgi:outer membrane receptor protein involved in Fe transport